MSTIPDPLRAGMESGALLPMAGDLLMPLCEVCGAATDGKHSADIGGGAVDLCVACAHRLCACESVVIPAGQDAVDDSDGGYRFLHGLNFCQCNEISSAGYVLSQRMSNYAERNLYRCPCFKPAPRITPAATQRSLFDTQTDLLDGAL